VCQPRYLSPLQVHALRGQENTYVIPADNPLLLHTAKYLLSWWRQGTVWKAEHAISCSTQTFHFHFVRDKNSVSAFLRPPLGETQRHPFHEAMATARL
jgi:hypothetical protein